VRLHHPSAVDRPASSRAPIVRGLPLDVRGKLWRSLSGIADVSIAWGPLWCLENPLLWKSWKSGSDWNVIKLSSHMLLFQGVTCYSPWVHEERVRLRSAFDGAGFDAVLGGRDWPPTGVRMPLGGPCWATARHRRSWSALGRRPAASLLPACCLPEIERKHLTLYPRVKHLTCKTLRFFQINSAAWHIIGLFVNRYEFWLPGPNPTLSV